jgi:exopolyphosphatase/guanosine-5'-triphosphate,3'-diphosphate pyrophosphatase
VRAAVIAAGTNSCRLLIARYQNGDLRPEHHDIRGTRLGEGLGASGVLSPEAMERTLAAITDFAQLGGRTDRLFVIGTCALRDAANAPEFVSSVKQATGADMRVLTGIEEARASFDGALWALAQVGQTPRRWLTVVDVGGGSTEIAVKQIADRLDVPEADVASLQVGAVRMTERFFKHDPPLAPEITACRTAVRLELAPISLERFAPGAVAGSGGGLAFVGGTADTAARMLHGYGASDVHVAELSLTDLDDLLRLVTSLPTAERKRLHGLPESRADIFPAGLLIVDEIARHARTSSFFVCEADLLVGYLREQLSG